MRIDTKCAFVASVSLQKQTVTNNTLLGLESTTPRAILVLSNVKEQRCTTRFGGCGFVGEFYDIQLVAKAVTFHAQEVLAYRSFHVFGSKKVLP